MGVLPCDIGNRFGLLRWGRYVREAGAEPIEEAGPPSRQHRSLSQIKEAIIKIFALTEAGSVRAVMPGACGTIAQPTKNISQDALLEGLNCCIRRLHLSYLAERKWPLYKKRIPSANAPEVPKSCLYT
jgi:hypothetical protein